MLSHVGIMDRNIIISTKSLFYSNPFCRVSQTLSCSTQQNKDKFETEIEQKRELRQSKATQERNISCKRTDGAKQPKREIFAVREQLKHYLQENK